MIPVTAKESPMQIVTLYLSTAAIFLVIDAIMLRLYMAPLFERYIGPMMLENIRLAPAALFYMAYVAGLLYLVSVPALKAGAPILIPAAILGFMAYGTFEFTNYAILKGWNLRMVITDVAWGTVLTALSAWGGLAITKAIFKV
jgi:uncharacterized membrane protein